ncbi:hypothetical protein M8C21_005792, partial [Ambrosia artemisiifolia]
SGKSHTVVVTDDGLSLSFGWNKHRQLGTDSAKTELLDFHNMVNLDMDRTWRLGHREQKEEFIPRRVDVFTRHNVLPPGAVVSAGSANSAVTAGAGQMYMWGKTKNHGDDLMYPKPLMDLRTCKRLCGAKRR